MTDEAMADFTPLGALINDEQARADSLTENIVLMNEVRGGVGGADLVLRVDEEFAGGVAQGAGLLVKGFTEALQSEDAQCVLGYCHKPFWTLL